MVGRLKSDQGRLAVVHPKRRLKLLRKRPPEGGRGSALIGQQYGCRLPGKNRFGIKLSRPIDDSSCPRLVAYKLNFNSEMEQLF
jgi:hypothetical protein